ncbi:MAG: hypothetical protein IT262_11125 [Saprospiraceae bacterium]|nr:hypothetical protein [Saprospiraceae bacterium]
MKRAFSMPPELYAKMLDELSNLFFTEKLGLDSDMNFYRNDFWLTDTAVIDMLLLRKGAWEINLLFAHHKTPLKFLSRRITSHSCPKRARIMAFYMRRLAAKDQRGTLSLDINDLNLTLN